MASAGKAISTAPTKPGCASGQADTGWRSVPKKLRQASSCSARPKARGIQRACRVPTQKAAAPSSAQMALVHCASSASGTASVTKPTPSARKHSTSSR